MKISVIIPTYGDSEIWNPRAQRAVQSVMNQTVEAQIIRIHGENLATARNEGAAKADAGWLIFLDADDELDPHYIEAMETGLSHDMEIHGGHEIFQPSTVEFNNEGQVGVPEVIPTYDLMIRNYLIIGSMVAKVVFEDTKGFDPSLPLLEDYDFWLQCHKVGAEVTQCPEAIYRVRYNENSRNLANPTLHGQIAVQIRQRYGL